MKHLKLFGSLLIIVALVLTACASGAGKGTIKIATQSPLSGGQSTGWGMR